MVLRIKREDAMASRVTLALEGRLEGASSALLERECSHLLEAFGAVAVDLSGVCIVDKAGVAALRRLHLAGVEIRECSDLIASILEGEGIPAHRNGIDADGAGA